MGSSYIAAFIVTQYWDLFYEFCQPAYLRNCINKYVNTKYVNFLYIFGVSSS
jgi:hypothetical protein